MTTMETLPAFKPLDYKSDIKPVWCPGCGDFSVLGAITRALAELAIAPEQAAIVSGIGCSSRLPAYTSLYGFHAIHGRALPVATGLKVARPDLTVLVASGDGDGFSIGGNHFLQACRRDIDLTYIVMDNSVYGMTKGQASPTTEPDWTQSKLTPEGTGIAALQPLELALSCGASFIARGFSGQPQLITRYIAEAIAHPGFSMVQILSPCITWRPEQRDYAKQVHEDFKEPVSDRREARRLLIDDDGRATGILFKAQPQSRRPRHTPATTLADIESSLSI